MRWNTGGIRGKTALLVVALLQVTAPTSGATPSAPPLTPGTTWMYQYTITPASSGPRTGALKLTYGGPTAYQGKTFYYTEVSNTVTPGLIVRDYYVWRSGHFWQAAERAYDTQRNDLEVRFDKTFPFDLQERVSGRASLVQNGVYQGEVSWSVRVSYAGPVKVTVPAGTFQAERWDTEFWFGGTRQVQTVESVGFTDLQADVRLYRDGALSSTTHRALVNGPVR